MDSESWFKVLDYSFTLLKLILVIRSKIRFSTKTRTKRKSD